MRITDMNWMQVEEYLKHDDSRWCRWGVADCARYLSLSVDSILSERVSVEAAEPLGVPVFPVVGYGVTPYFAAYPGSVSLRERRMCAWSRTSSTAYARRGFGASCWLSGHGGNEPAGALATEWMADHPEVQVKFYQWWQGPKMMAVVRSIDPVGSHASWFENFAWTRLPGVDMPTEQKILPDRSGYPRLVGEALRQYLGDGNYGGFYQRSDEEMQRIWDAAVVETHELIGAGWG
ncbi:MAG: creatininase family protein [Caldilineaceae bacterium]